MNVTGASATMTQVVTTQSQTQKSDNNTTGDVALAGPSTDTVSISDAARKLLDGDVASPLGTGITPPPPPPPEKPVPTPAPDDGQSLAPDENSLFGTGITPPGKD